MKCLLYVGNKLSGHGFNVTTIETLGPLLAGEGFDVHYASSKRNQALRLLDMLFTTLRFSQKADYVIIDTYSALNFWSSLMVSQICRLFNRKYIPILHGGNLPERLKDFPYCCRLIFNNAYKNVTPSHYLFDAFTEAGFSNLVYIPNSIEIGSYLFRDRATLQPKLLWVRSLARIYNCPMALRVMELLQKKHANAELCMVGPDKENLLPELTQKASELKVSVEFKGKLEKEQWLALSVGYDIFINTTHSDNMPVSLLEAMALGLPIVSTNVGGIPFLLQNGVTALLVEDDNAEAMAAAVERILTDTELREKIIRNARQKADEYDWTTVKNKWLALLR
ncbi:MAG TPA: glycosyltransferase family 4 protein [Flavobacterium sp.]|jgi:glycosyltransferase involved in cell wall biosynthesis